MSRRPALVTQADVARAIRAARGAGLTIVRIITRPDGVAIETADCVDAIPVTIEDRPPRRIIL